ncbi:MAG: hypothetical protein Q9222_004240 [Ikaeria aurantiellina]
MSPQRYASGRRLHARSGVNTSTTNVILGCTITFGVLAIALGLFLLYKAYMRTLDHQSGKDHHSVARLEGHRPKTKVRDRTQDRRGSPDRRRKARGRDWADDGYSQNYRSSSTDAILGPRRMAASPSFARRQPTNYPPFAQKNPYLDPSMAGKDEAPFSPLITSMHPASEASQLISALDVESFHGDSRQASKHASPDGHSGSMTDEKSSNRTSTSDDDGHLRGDEDRPLSRMGSGAGLFMKPQSQMAPLDHPETDPRFPDIAQEANGEAAANNRTAHNLMGGENPEGEVNRERQ